jgi:Ca-activated chloride channel family protein
MKKQFEQHRERLTPQERRAVWVKLTEGRRSRRGTGFPWRILAPATAGVFTIVLLSLMVLERGTQQAEPTLGRAMKQHGEMKKGEVLLEERVTSKSQDEAAAPEGLAQAPAALKARDLTLPQPGRATVPKPPGASTPPLAGANEQQSPEVAAMRTAEELASPAARVLLDQDRAEKPAGESPARSDLPASPTAALDRTGAWGGMKPPAIDFGDVSLRGGRPTEKDLGSSLQAEASERRAKPEDLQDEEPAAPGSQREAVAVTSPVTGSPAVAGSPALAGRTEPLEAADLRQAATGEISGVVRDSTGSPVAFAAVLVLDTAWGAATRQDGTFTLRNIPPGEYSVRVSVSGFAPEVAEHVRVRVGERVELSLTLRASRSTIARENPPPGTWNRPEGPAIPPLHVDRPETREREHLADKLEPTFGEFYMSQRSAAAVPESPSTVLAFELPALRKKYGEGGGTQRVPVYGGTTLPNDEVYDSMFFQNYGANPLVLTEMDSLSTFAVDVDNASYTLTRRYIDGGHLPDRDAPRVEEFVNFFRQDYPEFEDTDFRILFEGAPSPFGKGFELLRVGVKARVIAEKDRKPAGLVFVIDVSGSMDRENRLGLVQRSLRLLLDELRPDDTVGIVVYGSRGRVLLEPSSLEDRRRIADAIESLRPAGSTNAEEGLKLGFEMARRNYRPGAINRIILCSDGVANVGRTGPESILEEVRREADRGIELTTIGFGMGNYNDVLMEQLADQGDGSYYYVDGIDEARRVFVQNLTGMLQTVARDAKIQVEFDPRLVRAYRLLGFENRDIADRDFRNDRVDAGEIGAGHEVTALYEIRLVDGVERGHFATAHLRYARPDLEGEGASDVREIAATVDVSDLRESFEKTSPRFQLDALVAEFAEILRHSYWAKDSRIADLTPLARRLADRLRDDPAVVELADLVARAADLQEKLSPEERVEPQMPPVDPYYPVYDEHGIRFSTRNER